ncbi:hypothetical protein GA516_14010 [Lactobacillus pentosus]|uniref:Uncharacterized protein n=2 Tax=Lactiplantibacillus pentosus TaxID=1589 RepID=A0A2S9VXD6_LACPE|nr:hypothetical protein [Lactiplantibacillus pentosus]AYG36873.1 hypothetical protein CFK27_02400 [Lactiplantibacillus pentosus]AYG42502.1 hypothetical protein CFI14_15980 [Lactiplantibacillus pentosus]MCB5222520.1 hypothetical protein [Lactiplantibacillus pentosus]MCS8604684.1 hypothetical protein [Lactiplantibacillus pentosus]MCT3290629.1 hypothetical protein [Lactiplantibacillus pentosus]
MDFFHSTSKENADKILAQKRINPTQYDFPYFMDKLLDNIDTYDSYADFPNRWLGIPEMPWLGSGVYCFKFLDEAQAYTPNSTVIKIDVYTPVNEFDFDSPEDLMMIANYFQNNFEEDLRNKFFDDEVIDAYLLVGTFLLNFIMDGMGNSSKAQCVCLSLILFILVKIRKKPFKPDIVSYKFKLDDIVGKYYTIRKMEKIKGLAGV